VLFAEGGEVINITVFEGRWQIVPWVNHSVREGAPPSFAPRVWRLEPWVLVIVAAQHSSLNDARPCVAIGGAAGTPLEEDQVGVLKVHGHRHHHLLVHRLLFQKICQKSLSPERDTFTGNLLKLYNLRGKSCIYMCRAGCITSLSKLNIFIYKYTFTDNIQLPCVYSYNFFDIIALTII